MTIKRTPLVKLIIALLDDNHGISTKAWEALTAYCGNHYGTRPPPPELQKIMGAITGHDNRVYLPENWNKPAAEFGPDFGPVKIPVIGTMGADGQVKFKEQTNE